jgi:hypothetical protein
VLPEVEVVGFGFTGKQAEVRFSKVFDRQEVQRAVSEEVFRQISAAMVIVEAPSGKILFVNRQTQKWTQEYIGQSIPSELRYLLIPSQRSKPQSLAA